jgi:tRNA threonylcarbamoyladenosine biosynthesis protein TsaE
LRTKIHHIISRSPEETLHFGALLGKYVTKGSVIALSGELGSGKTCLTQGIAKGLGVPGHFYVTSPSFTLINEYPGLLRLFHVDLYRIDKISELDEMGLDEMLESDSVTVIEWAEKIADMLPRERLSISLSIVDDRTRDLRVTASGQSAVNLIERCLVAFGSSLDV